ncbi:MAG: putative porin [Rubrivivax sp.]|nr:putative porin [Rubrivivax sp.]
MHPRFPNILLAALIAAAVAAPARADEKAELQQLRATTLALIDALVAQGLLTRERADALLKAAAAPAAPLAATAPTLGPPGPQWGAPKVAGTPPPVVRVPYIPESLKAEITEQIRNEMLATTRAEGWADPRTLPAWLRGLTISGDLRVRAQQENFDAPRYAPDSTGLCDIVGGNLPAACYRSQGASPAWSPDVTNTSVDRDRLTLRARLGVEAKVSDDTTMGLRLATGTGSGPTSSSVTLGSGFNKLGVVIDRAFLRWEPRYDLRLLAGRMANPFFGSDLVWPDDLGLDGVAVQGELNLVPGAFAFGTVGAFPLLEFGTGRRDAWLYALQVGTDWALGDNTQLRVGLGVYQFSQVEGVRETTPPPTGALAGTTGYFSSQYPANLRLKGNTLINLNDPASTAAPTWGLAAKFRPINLTTQITTRIDEFLSAGLNLDWVKNGGFDLADIRARAGTDAVLGLQERNTGLQLKFNVGMAALSNQGDWQLFAAWRKFERDAWIDGFTDTSWHGGGGTNYQGWQLGGSYTFDRRTTLGLRATSTRNLSDGEANLSSAPLKVDVLQLDLNTRF